LYIFIKIMTTIDAKSVFAESKKAHETLKTVVNHTALQKNSLFSTDFNANIFLKREDLQIVRSYKIRGAYTKIISLNTTEKSRGIVCASAGNHAQGVAYSCQLLGINGTIYMPITTPKQKVKQVKLFGKEFVSIVLIGDTFDDSYQEALRFSTANQVVFIHPFNDEKVIAGQGTVALEILEDITVPIDYLFVPIGGGGLAAGMASVFEFLSPNTKIIGIEPEGAPAMKEAITQNKVIKLEKIDKFVDGAAVQAAGEMTYQLLKNRLHDIVLVPEGKVCTTILSLYNDQAMVVEPAGALAIAALDFYKEKIAHKNVVCIVSGSNNDILRTEEIRERSLFYEGLKHYFLIEFPQRPGSLKLFVSQILNEGDDITHFQFSKKNQKEFGPAVVGIEIQQKENIETIFENLKKYNFSYRYLNDNKDLYTLLI
jgi:threonine dehydratase